MKYHNRILITLAVVVMSVYITALAGMKSGSWSLNPAMFRFDMSLYFNVDDEAAGDPELYEIAAFVGDDCRGIAEKIDLPDGGSCLYMRIRSNVDEGEEMVFMMRDKSTGRAVRLANLNEESFVFQPGERVGMPSEPYMLHRLFTLDFNVGDEVIESLELPVGAEITLPEAPAKEGHTFAGWGEVPSTMPADNVTVNGTYTVNNYKLVFKVGDEVVFSEEIPYGSQIEVPEMPEKEGYTFTGWENVPLFMPASNLEFTGEYTVNSYTLTVYLNDEVYLEKEIEYGADVEIPDPEVADNEIFDGWNDEIPSTMPACDVTIHGTVSQKQPSAVAIHSRKDTINVYTPAGVLVMKNVKPAEAQRKLTPGVYIINGKKIRISR